jgi:hypothetical protein
MNAPVSAGVSPVVGRDGGTWHPTAFAMGPFGGLHGGVVSGTLAGELETRGLELGWGQPVSATVYLVRPAPLEPFTTQIEEVRGGARLTVMENSLIAGGKLRAKASMAFLKDTPVPGIVPPVQESFDPDSLPVWGFASMVTGTTYLSAVDVRDDKANSFIWVKPVNPLGPNTVPFAQAMAIADYATLFSVYLEGERPKAGGWPNADISVHLSRLPESDWIGIRPRSGWYPNGSGLTEAEIYDTNGWIGRSCQSAVLLPVLDPAG